jgi:hypothetical protein
LALLQVSNWDKYEKFTYVYAANGLMGNHVPVANFSNFSPRRGRMLLAGGFLKPFDRVFFLKKVRS